MTPSLVIFHVLEVGVKAAAIFCSLSLAVALVVALRTRRCARDRYASPRQGADHV